MSDDSDEIKILRKDVDHLKDEVKELKAFISLNQHKVQKKTPYGSLMLGLGLILTIIGVSLIVVTLSAQYTSEEVFILRIIGAIVFVAGIVITVRGIKRLK